MATGIITGGARGTDSLARPALLVSATLVPLGDTYDATSEIYGVPISTVADANGNWSLTLERTDTMTPLGMVYQLVREDPHTGESRTDYIKVLTGTHVWNDPAVLSSPPAAVPSGMLNANLLVGTIPDANMPAGVTAAAMADIEADLTEETTRATTAESTLTTNLSNEVTRAEGAEATLTTNLTAETNRATAAEALKAPLASPTFTGTVTVPDGVNPTDAAQLSDVTDEQTRAQAAESTNATAISTETTRATTAEGLRLLSAPTVPDNNAVTTRLFQVVPPTRTPFALSEWSSGPQSDGTYNHWNALGFNAEVQSTGGSPVSGQPALYMGFEDGWIDVDRTFTDGVTTSGSPTVTSATAAFVAADIGKPISGSGIPSPAWIGVINSATSIGLSSTQGSNTPTNATATATGVTVAIRQSGMEWYISYWSPDHTTIQMFRPFYARVRRNNNNEHQAVINCDIGTDGFGTFNVTSGGFNPVFQVSANATSVTATLVAPNNSSLIFQDAGGQKWLLGWSTGNSLFVVTDRVNGRNQVQFTAGATSAAALTEFASQVKADGLLTAAAGFTVSTGAVTLPAASIADAALSAHVPLLSASADQTFTGRINAAFLSGSNGGQFVSSGGYTSIGVIAIAGSASHVGLQVQGNTGATGDLFNATVGGTKVCAINAYGGVQPGNGSQTAQAAGAVYAGSGAPSISTGINNGDIWIRTDGGAGTTIYQRRAGAWAATAA